MIAYRLPGRGDKPHPAAGIIAQKRGDTMSSFEVEVEARLTAFVKVVRSECDGVLPPDTGLALAVEDIGHSLGLDDAALRRVLEVEVLPSQERRYTLPTGAVSLRELAKAAAHD